MNSKCYWMLAGQGSQQRKDFASGPSSSHRIAGWCRQSDHWICIAVCHYIRICFLYLMHLYLHLYRYVMMAVIQPWPTAVVDGPVILVIRGMSTRHSPFTFTCLLRKYLHCWHKNCINVIIFSLAFMPYAVVLPQFHWPGNSFAISISAVLPTRSRNV